MEGTSGTKSVPLGAYEARLLAKLVGNALDQDHDDIAGDWLAWLLDEDQVEMIDVLDEAGEAEQSVEEANEAFARIRETLAGLQETLNGVAR